MRQSPRGTAILVAVVVLTTSLAAPLEAQRPVSTIVIAVGGDVDAFNEYVSRSTLAYDLAGQLYLGLMEELPSPPGSAPRFGPALARSWEFAGDGRSVTFHLRDDVRWSDDRPVTAEDVRYTWRAQIDPELGWPDVELKSSITDVRVDDAHRVTFLLEKPGPYTLLDINEGRILPSHAYASIPPGHWMTTDFSKRLVTNGPYRLASWKPGQAIILEKNPGAPVDLRGRIDRIVFRIVPDAGIRLQQLLAGETDVLHAVDPESIDRIEGREDLRLVRIDERMYTYICWNMRKTMFADRRVRRALTLSIDRASMLSVLAKGMGRPSSGPIVSGLWAADASLEPLPFDPERARRLLDDAGWRDADGDGVREKDGIVFAFDLEFNRGNTLREKIALRASAQLADVGIRATPRAIEWAAFLRKHREGNFDAFVASRIASTRVNLDSFETGSPRNDAGYSSDRIDELNARATAAPSLEAARPLWAEAQRILAEDQPMTFLFEQDRLHAVTARLEGVEAGPLGLLHGLRDWRLDRSNP